MANDSKIKDLIRLGFTCNVNCKFCNFIESNEPDYSDFSLLKIKEQIDELSANEVNYVSFSGGEPLLRDDLEEIIAYAKSKGITDIDLQTNAVLLDEDRVKKLKQAGLKMAFVSFHTHIPLVYEKLVERKKIFKPIVENIKFLLKNNIEVTLNPVINSLTYKYLLDYADFVIKEFTGIKSFSLSVIQPHGRALQYKKLIPDYGQLSPYIIKFREYIKNNSSIQVINPYCGLPMCLGGWYQDLDSNVEYIQNSSNYRIDKNKTYLECCQKCKFYKLCNGVWNEYLGIWGIPKIKQMFKPVIYE